MTIWPLDRRLSYSGFPFGPLDLLSFHLVVYDLSTGSFTWTCLGTLPRFPPPLFGASAVLLLGVSGILPSLPLHVPPGSPISLHTPCHKSSGVHTLPPPRGLLGTLPRFPPPLLRASAVLLWGVSRNLPSFFSPPRPPRLPCLSPQQALVEVSLSAQSCCRLLLSRCSCVYKVSQTSEGVNMLLVANCAPRWRCVYGFERTKINRLVGDVSSCTDSFSNQVEERGRGALYSPQLSRT